jgi:hypothetical protein
MEAADVKARFIFGLNNHFEELFKRVNAINPASPSKKAMKDLYVAVSMSIKDKAPQLLERIDPRSGPEHLAIAGTDFCYRECRLEEHGAQELIVMLAMDANELPQSYRTSIDTLLVPLPAKLVRVLMFVTTRKGGVAYDDTVLLALRNDDGTIDLRSFLFQWQVSGHHILPSGHLDDATEQRLISLTELVMWKDTVTLHELQDDRTRH